MRKHDSKNMSKHGGNVRQVCKETQLLTQNSQLQAFHGQTDENVLGGVYPEAREGAEYIGRPQYPLHHVEGLLSDPDWDIYLDYPGDLDDPDPQSARSRRRRRRQNQGLPPTPPLLQVGGHWPDPDWALYLDDPEPQYPRHRRNRRHNRGVPPAPQPFGAHGGQHPQHPQQQQQQPPAPAPAPTHGFRTGLWNQGTGGETVIVAGPPSHPQQAAAGPSRASSAPTGGTGGGGVGATGTHAQQQTSERPPPEHQTVKEGKKPEDK